MAKGNQSRVPAGSSSGGQFAGGSGGSSALFSTKGSGGRVLGSSSAPLQVNRSIALRHQIAQKQVLKKLGIK